MLFGREHCICGLTCIKNHELWANCLLKNEHQEWVLGEGVQSRYFTYSFSRGVVKLKEIQVIQVQMVQMVAWLMLFFGGRNWELSSWNFWWLKQCLFPGPPGAWLAKGDCSAEGVTLTHSPQSCYATNYDISCHIVIYIDIYIKSVPLFPFLSQNPHRLRHDLQWSGRTEAGQRTLKCTRTASTGAAWRSFSDRNISRTFLRARKWLQWNYSKVKQWTSKSQFQSKLFDPFWSLFVPFRLFFGVKQSRLLELCACDKASFQPGERPGRFPQRAWGQGHRNRGTAVCSCQCSKACSSQRWQGKVEKIDQLERDIQTARDFSGNWSMHQETRGPYVKSFCIMQRTKILILHWSWFCVRPSTLLVNCRSLARFDF